MKLSGNPSFIFCQYCRAEFGYDKVLDKYKYCPYDGHKLQDISIKVPPSKFTLTRKMK